MTGHCTE